MVEIFESIYILDTVFWVDFILEGFQREGWNFEALKGWEHLVINLKTVRYLYSPLNLY